MFAISERHVDVPPVGWHVEQAGAGPDILLLHGAGGAAQNWHGVMPILANSFRVTAVDLPGHAKSRRGPAGRMGLAPMAEDLARLLSHEGVRPVAIVGHSAGAALMLQLSFHLDPKPLHLIGVNAALSNFPGMAAWLFPVLAKGLAINPLVAPVVSRIAGPETVRNLLRSTGSMLSPATIEAYSKLLRDPKHIDGTLTMMAQWSLEALRSALPQIAIPTLLIAGSNDKTVAPDVSDDAAKKMPNAEVLHLAGLGHLAHEERPEAIASVILKRLADVPAGTS